MINSLYYVSSWVVVFVLLSWITASCYPLWSRILTKVKTDQAAFSLLLYGLLSPVAAFVAILLLSLPQFSSSFVAQHCHGQDCSPHGLEVSLTTLHAVTKVAIFVGLFTIVCTLIARQLMAGRSKFNTLNRLAESTPFTYKILDSDTAFAWCSGLINPKIFVSRKLTEALTKGELQVVLAHEQAHADRKDNLRKWCLHWATVAWPKQLKLRIRRDLSEVTELVCDLAFARVERNAQNIDIVMDAFKKCHAIMDEHGDAHSREKYQVRMQKLKRSWELWTAESQRGKGRSLALASLVSSMSFLWLTFVILTVHFGHPVLEWIAA